MRKVKNVYSRIIKWSLIWIPFGSGLSFFLIWGMLLGWFGVDVKTGDTGLYAVVMWILLVSIPVAMITLYSSAYLERREGDTPYFVPSGVFWLWSTLLILLISLWMISFFFGGEYRIYRQILRGFTSSIIIVAITGTMLVWLVPQDKTWSKSTTRWLLTILCIGVIAGGLLLQQDQIAWHLNNRANQDQGNQVTQRPLRTVTVTFRENFSTEEWERFLERLDWSLYGYYVKEGEVMVGQCDSQDILATINTSTNLVKIRQSFANQNSDINWYDACIREMKVTGTLQNEFERSLSQYRDEIGIGAEVVSIDWAVPHSN